MKALYSDDGRCGRQPAWAAALVVLLIVLAGCSEYPRELTMVKPRLDFDRQLAEDFARLFDDPQEIRIVLVDNPDPNRPGLDALKTGAADLALVSNTAIYDPDIAAVVPLYPTVLHIAHRQEEGEVVAGNLIVRLVEETVYAGPTGSPSRLLLEAAAKRQGVDPGEIDYVGDETTCADVVVVYAPILPGLEASIEPCGAYRLFSLGSPDEIGSGAQVDSITLLNPTLKPFIIPEDTYGALTPEPVVTLAVDKLLVARADMPAAVVYDLLSEILRKKPALSATHPGLFHQLTDDFDISGSAFVLHPGALAYLQRDEPDIYERYSGVAEVVVTLLIGLVSGLYAVYRIIIFRRKNRIDAFYRQALEIRDRAQAEGGQEAVSHAIEALHSLQDRAYLEMIDERLSADESFRIFVTLTHDIIADLKGEHSFRSV